MRDAALARAAPELHKAMVEREEAAMAEMRQQAEAEAQRQFEASRARTEAMDRAQFEARVRSEEQVRPSPLPLNSCRINTKSSTNEAKSPTPSPVTRSPWWLRGEGWSAGGGEQRQSMRSMSEYSYEEEDSSAESESE